MCVCLQAQLFCGCSVCFLIPSGMMMMMMVMVMVMGMVTVVCVSPIDSFHEIPGTPTSIIFEYV